MRAWPIISARTRSRILYTAVHCIVRNPDTHFRVNSAVEARYRQRTAEEGYLPAPGMDGAEAEADSGSEFEHEEYIQYSAPPPPKTKVQAKVPAELRSTK